MTFPPLLHTVKNSNPSTFQLYSPSFSPNLISPAIHHIVGSGMQFARKKTLYLSVNPIPREGKRRHDSRDHCSFFVTLGKQKK